MRVISEIDAKSSWSIITGIPKKLLGSNQGSFRLRGTDEISVEFKNSGSEWISSIPISSDGLQILQLYGPLALKGEWIIGQVGQSLDGKIATETGDSYYVTGKEDLLRLHRVRAIADAVIVGAETVLLDDPRLTVRRVPGSNPARVILDPQRRIKCDKHVLNDQCARTIVVHDKNRDSQGVSANYESVGLDCCEVGGFDLGHLVAVLRERGLRRILVEGGGMTVSRFFQAELLDRIHVTVAPMIIGSGRPSFHLPAIGSLAEAVRPACRRFELGNDVLFDLDLKTRN
ncbi:MAG: RibD family protein [Longimicrobiales bacterium]